MYIEHIDNNIKTEMDYFSLRFFWGNAYFIRIWDYKTKMFMVGATGGDM